MDIDKLYQDYGIRRAFEGDKHYRKGWANIPCPFCTGNRGNHLGFNLQHGYYRCWRCGHHQITDVFIRIFGVSFNQAKKLISQYKGRVFIPHAEIVVKKLSFKMPGDTQPLVKSKPAMTYMHKIRKFSRRDTHWVTKQFLLQATGCMGFLDYGEKELDLSYRIIAPIFSKNEMVSWQSRDFTDEAFLKYITCPAILEMVEHKKVLYNAPDPLIYRTIILCEGIVDVWKVSLAGFQATCCFGVEYTYDQFKLLLEYDRILIFLDPDKAGSEHANKLMKQLIFAGKDADIVKNSTDCDPGDMSVSMINTILNAYAISN